MAGKRVRFRILGPLEVEGAGTVRITAARQQIVLAMLLLEANKVVSVDRLVDAVWDDSPPPTAKGQIQICVSGVRRLLGEAGQDGRITTRPPGYILHVAEGELDLHDFNTLVNRGRTALARQELEAAATAFREAIDLFQGAPLTGIDSRVVQAAAARIGERLLGVREECLDVELRLGRHHESIDELTALVTDHPLRERLVGLLMTALYRAGRQVDALEVYRLARLALVEDLGLEPGEPLRKLERAILNGDGALDLPGAPAPAVPAPAAPPPAAPPASAPAPPAPATAAVPRMTPSDIPDFTGHDELVAQLVRYLTGDDHPGDRNTVPVVLLTGRGGAGKTTLAVHLAHKLVDAFPDGQLYVQLGGGRPQIGTVSQILERFLRALGIAGSAVPDSIEERASTFRSQVAGRRLLVILDDVTDVRQVQYLLPGSPTCGVIATSRLRLAGIPGSHLVEIGTLDPHNAVGLLATMVGPDRVSAEPSEALKLVELCGRLPLALRIAAARLAARPHWKIQQLTERLGDEGRRLDELMHGGLGVRASIALTYEYLDADAQRLFRLLGILEAADFAAWVAAPLLDRDALLAADVLETLVDARLVDVVQGSGTATRYRLHDLVRVYARERLAAEEPPAERLAALKRMLGAWLYLGECAHRQLYGGDYTVIHSDAERFELPRDVVRSALHDPLLWYENERSAVVAAVLQACQAGAADYCWDLAITMVTLFETRSYLDDWRTTHEAALLVTQQMNDRRGEATMLYSIGALDIAEQRFDEASVRLNLALTVFEEVGEAHGRALALRNLAFLDRTRGDLDRAWVRYEEALAGLRQFGDAAGEAHVLNGMAQIELDRGRPAAATDLLNQAMRIAKAANSTRVRAQVLHRLGELRLAHGELELAEQDLSQALELVREGRDRLGNAYVLHGLGIVKLRQQDYDRAAEFLSHGYSLACHSGDRLANARFCLALASLYQARRDYRSAKEWAFRAIELFDQVAMPGGQAQARELLSQLRHETV
ncbi:MAG TPA: BTAD domain-containing putative transcriptional regulator [Micromonosporaceae bacterium]